MHLRCSVLTRTYGTLHEHLHHIHRSGHPFPFFTHVSRIFLAVLKQKPVFLHLPLSPCFYFSNISIGVKVCGRASFFRLSTLLSTPLFLFIEPPDRVRTKYPPMAYHSRLSLRREKASFLDSILDPIRLMYYQYEVTFSTYVMTPSEKFVMNTVVLLFLSLLSIGVVTYLPQFLFRVCSRLLWLYKGADRDVKLDIGSGHGNGTAEWIQMGSAIGHHS